MLPVVRPTWAAALCALATCAAQAECTRHAGNEGFSPYRENFAIANQMHNNGWAAKDEVAMRVQYSTKYTFWGCKLERLDDNEPDKGDFFLGYTGMFDFYMLSRYSDPVINRMSNIGLHYRVPQQWTDFLDEGSLELGVEHRSTGQVFEPTDPGNPAILEAAYQKADDDARYRFDTLSRGSNYISLQLRWDQKIKDGGLLHYKVRSHSYFAENTEITWGPLKGQGISIRNYDLMQFGVDYETGSQGVFSMNWRVGSSGFKTDSLDVTWRSAKSPLFVRAHFGPMNTLSNYTQRQNSVGIGFLFFSGRQTPSKPVAPTCQCQPNS